MDSYKKPYLTLFNAVTDALKELNAKNYGRVEDILCQAQQDAEERFLKQTDK